VESGGLHCREEESSIGVGENSTLGGIPKQSRIKTTLALAHRRNYGPRLLQTLALYSCMTFENAKVAKIEKN